MACSLSLRVEISFRGFMASLLNFENLVMALIKQGDISSAQQALDEMAISPKIDINMIRFLRAKLNLHQGAYKKSLEFLDLIVEPTDQRLVEVLCDKALCYYQLGLPSELKRCLEQAEHLLQSLRPNHEVRNIFACCLFIAKLFEEIGAFDKAASLLKYAEKLNLTDQQNKSLKVQKLRLNIELNDLDLAHEIYTDIIQGWGNNQDVEIEREHALLLADCKLFGFTAAAQRYSYLQSLNLVLADRIFLQSEMIENAILEGQLDFLKQIHIYSEIESCYEQEQIKLVKAFLELSNYVPATLLWEKSLSSTSLLRLLAQACLLFPDAAKQLNLSDKYHFFCQRLSPLSTRQIFTAKIAKETPSQLLSNRKEKTLELREKKIPMTSKLFWQLTELINKSQQKMDLAEVIRQVYAEEPNTQHFDRLRINIYRINNEIKNHFLIGDIFHINKQGISINIDIKDIAS